MPNIQPYRAYVWKSLKWITGNAFFGLAPLLFMCYVFAVSEETVGADEIVHLVHDGVILFVCCAVMGAVLVEFLLAGFSVKGSSFFAVIVFPFFIISTLSLDYLFIHQKVIDGRCFDINSKTSIIVIVFTLGYSIFVKADLYLKEDTRHDNL